MILIMVITEGPIIVLIKLKTPIVNKYGTPKLINISFLFIIVVLLLIIIIITPNIINNAE